MGLTIAGRFCRWALCCLAAGLISGVSAVSPDPPAVPRVIAQQKGPNPDLAIRWSKGQHLGGAPPVDLAGTLEMNIVGIVGEVCGSGEILGGCEPAWVRMQAGFLFHSHSIQTSIPRTRTVHVDQQAMHMWPAWPSMDACAGALAG
jgi:hypothetical protein